MINYSLLLAFLLALLFMEITNMLGSLQNSNEGLWLCSLCCLVDQDLREPE
jgi:hypothetical protein